MAGEGEDAPKEIKAEASRPYVGKFPFSSSVQALSPAQVPDLNWKVRGAGDFNGDFKPDLIWQNEVTGQISAWLMDGTTRRDGRLSSPSVVEDTDQRLLVVTSLKCSSIQPIHRR